MELLKNLKNMFFMMGVFCSIWGFSKNPMDNFAVKGGAILILIAVLFAAVPATLCFIKWIEKEEG